jgi:hypothetical protein
MAAPYCVRHIRVGECNYKGGSYGEQERVTGSDIEGAPRAECGGR